MNWYPVRWTIHLESGSEMTAHGSSSHVKGSWFCPRSKQVGAAWQQIWRYTSWFIAIPWQMVACCCHAFRRLQPAVQISPALSWIFCIAAPGYCLVPFSEIENGLILIWNVFSGCWINNLLGFIQNFSEKLTRFDRAVQGAVELSLCPITYPHGNVLTYFLDVSNSW